MSANPSPRPHPFPAWMLCLLCAACSGSLPEPPKTQHPNEAYDEVPYPPPAALAETVPPRPDQRGVVWLEGDWVFRGATYAWVRGGWTIAPEKARYAVSNIVYTRDGRILFAPAAWYDSNGQKLERVRPIAPAKTPSNEYTSETQTAR
ncbi:MAG TPA: hypothetical protein VFQ61_00225 [Polyangiaceae bacterium]|nr:hypothetical protein [Polyangiaceae bacterium]